MPPALAVDAPPARRPIPQNDYADLKRLVAAAGLLEAQDRYYVIKVIAAAAMLALAIVAALFSPWTPAVLGAAVLLAFASTQVALLAHDVGHRQAFRGRRVNAVARLVFGNLLLGVSQSWWVEKHNQHHATPNHVDKDPDILFSFLAFAPEQRERLNRRVRPLLAVQAFVFLAVLPLQSFGMRLASFTHLTSGRAPRPIFQAALIALHFGLYALLLIALGSWQIALAFVLIHQTVFSLYNSSVFASNHKGMPVIREDGRLDFLREQVVTSRNVHGRALTDFYYGGLNYQIEHHLFPTMPRNNLSRAQAIVRPFCEGRGVPYRSTGLFEAYREGLVHLHRAGRGTLPTPGTAAS